MDGKIKKILSLLHEAYGRPPRFSRSAPVDELIRTVLSQNTTDKNSLRAFAVLKKTFNSWEALVKADARRISRLIRHAGLADIKARRIKDILHEIKRREGKINLARLKKLGTEEALDYLESFKGVGPKTAACVLLFSFGMPVMPVDTHIFRVTRRLGLIEPKTDIKEAHRILSAIVPKPLTLRLRSGSSPELLSRDLIYEFHLGIIEHGRKACRAQVPRCGICVLYKICKFKYKKRFAEKG